MTENIEDIKKKVDKRVQMLEYYFDVLVNMHLNNPENDEIVGVKNYILAILNENKNIQDSLNSIEKYSLHYASINNAFKERTNEDILRTLVHNMKVAHINIADYIPVKERTKEDEEALKEIDNYVEVHLDEIKEAIDNNPFEEQVNKILTSPVNIMGVNESVYGPVEVTKTLKEQMDDFINNVSLHTKDMNRVEVSPLEIEEASYVIIAPDESNIVMDDTIIPEEEVK